MVKRLKSPVMQKKIYRTFDLERHNEVIFNIIMDINEQIAFNSKEYMEHISEMDDDSHWEDALVAESKVTAYNQALKIIKENNDYFIRKYGGTRHGR